MTTSHKPWEALAPGTQWRGFWPVGYDLPDVPVLAVKGGLPGPMLLVVGGVHGDEYEGAAAIYTLFGGLDAAELSGRLVGLPVANVAAWNARNRTTPADGGDLNRAFPGHSRSVTGRLAHMIFEEFVHECVALIDLHSGGLRLKHLPMGGWYAGAKRAEGLARSMGGTLHPWRIPDVPGVLSYEAHRVGKIALGLEWGGGGWLDPTGVTAYADGIRRVMAALGMLPSTDVECHDDRPPIAGDYQTAGAAGLFSACVALGDRVIAGSCLGLLHSSVGEVLAEVSAERDGRVAALAHLPLVGAEDRVAYVG